jgi:hypothetical protein
MAKTRRRRTRSLTASPGFIPPQLATLVTQAPDGPGWLHEIKLDGYRMAAGLDNGGVRLDSATRRADRGGAGRRVVGAVAARQLNHSGASTSSATTRRAEPRWRRRGFLYQQLQRLMRSGLPVEETDDR